jgi:murein L,D-transpeptidase YcbB/YkuD
MKKNVLYLTATLTFIISCSQHSQEAAAQSTPRDTTITIHNAYSPLFLDSASMEKFIHETAMHDSLANRLRDFYNTRNYEYAWFFNDGIADYAATFLQMRNDYIAYSGDSTIFDPRLQQMVDSINEAPSFNVSNNDILNTELMLTSQFFRYARRAYQGSNRLNTQDLGWYIPRKKIDPGALLDSLVRNKGQNFTQYEPVNRQYQLLKDYLLKYYALKQNGSWQKVNFDKKSYSLGESSAAIVLVKKRLLQEGDLTKNDTTTVFDTVMQNALKRYQHRYGLKEDGKLGATIMNEMNTPLDDYIQTILINMERMRWVPAQPTTDYLLVNIPEFRLHIYENGNYKWSMNVVVGTKVHNTVIFTGNMKYVVFSPYWNVPRSIINKEILPAMKRNKNYLSSHNMEWNGGNIRQKPGPNNALGLVKFLFPNEYSIYLHDTPSKSLFGESKRAFSHGCIRLSEPRKLAEFLLRKDQDWDPQKIVQAMNRGKEKYVTLKQPVPVFIGYFTSWVDRDGKLNFRDDIYGHDKETADHLFAKAIVK